MESLGPSEILEAMLWEWTSRDVWACDSLGSQFLHFQSGGESGCWESLTKKGGMKNRSGDALTKESVSKSAACQSISSCHFHIVFTLQGSITSNNGAGPKKKAQPGGVADVEAAGGPQSVGPWSGGEVRRRGATVEAQAKYQRA